MSSADIATLANQAWALMDANRLDEALDVFVRIMQADPDNAEAWMMQGTILGEHGALADARSRLARAIELDPNYADPYLVLARIDLSQGQPEAAAENCRHAVGRDPQYLEAWVTLGGIAAQLGRYDEAELASRRVLALTPTSLEAQATLAYALRMQYKFAEAITAYRDLARLLPRDISPWLELAATLLVAGEPGESVECYRRARDLAPQQSEIHHGLGNALLALGRLAEAESSLREALRLRLDAAALNDLANVLIAQGRFADAEPCLRQALALAPELPEALANLGLVLQTHGRSRDALPLYRRAVELKPECAAFHKLLAGGLSAIGDLEGALQSCESALRITPDAADLVAAKATILEHQGKYRDAYNLLAGMMDAAHPSLTAIIAFAGVAGRFKESEKSIALLETMSQRSDLKPNERQKVHASLGSLYDRNKCFDQAFFHYQSSNRLKTARFNAESHRHFIDRLIRVYSHETLSATLGPSKSPYSPIFIVGMPRSGTSLVEQIIASHPEVHGAGELDDIIEISRDLPKIIGTAQLFPECMLSSTPMVLQVAADRYTAALTELSPTRHRVTDKMPHNFLYLGMIQQLFPTAHVIHIMRDPLDTCLSCYFQEFSASHAYAYDLVDLGTYYNEYERIMGYWRAVLGLNMLEIRYEDLVADQENTTRRLTDFLGLPWSEKCLAFHESQRYVATPSYDQVRQPIYSGSVARWKHYEQHLTPLLESLNRGSR